MKMSEVFNLPVTPGDMNNGNNDTFIGDRDFWLADFRNENTLEEAKINAHAAAHAINCHDELVEALEVLIKDISFKHALHLDNNIGASTRRALMKAKEILAKG